MAGGHRRLDGVQAHRLKTLGALVGLEEGDPHLRRHRDHPRQNGPVIVGHGGIEVLVQQAFVDEFGDALVGQVGVHRPGAVAQKGGHLVHVPGFPTLQNDGDRRTLSRLDEVLLQGRHRQQGGDGHVVLIHPPVREDQQVGPALAGLVTPQEQLGQGPLQGGILVVEQGDLRRLQPRPLQGLKLQQCQVGEDGAVQLEDPAIFRGILQQVPVGAQVHRGVGDNLLPQGVDGRVGHLGKALLKIVKQRRLPPGQGRYGHIRPHGEDGLLPLLRHGQDRAHHILIGVTKHGVEFVPGGLVMAGHPVVGHRQLVQGMQLPVQPLPVRVLGGVGLFEAPVSRKGAGAGIHYQHLAGTQAGLADHLAGGQIQHPHFRGQHHPAI